MRRKSTRTTGKTSPEKGKQADSSVKKSRRSSKRRRKSTSESENSDEEQDTKHSYENETTPPPLLEKNTDLESNENIIEKESDVQDDIVEKSDRKFKLKRNRISNSDGNDANSEDKHSARRSRRRGSPKVEERTQEDDDEDNKGKGKSKSKTKSKIEKSEQLNEPETHNESEISTNAQVTPQSPHIDNPNVVDVAQSAEDKNNCENEEDPSSEDTKNTMALNKQESVNQADNDIVEKVYNSVDNNETVTELLSENKTESNPEVSGNKEDHIEDTVADEVTINETTNEPNNEETHTNLDGTSAENIKSGEDFVGFAKEPVEQKHGTEFIEEPMDISMDVSFTIKTDDSSINITEAEETNEENTTEKFSEDLSKKPNINKKIQLIRDPSNKAVINRKKGWGSSTLALDLFTSKSVDTNVIQTIFTSVEFLDETDVKLELDIKDPRKSLTEVKERTRLERSVSSNDSDYRKNDIKQDEKEQEDNANIIAMNRKISIVDDSASKLKPPPSPAKNPLSNVLFITNLVRPFTIKQLKELLERTGTIKNNGFWTDKIKSKCYVQYEIAEDAEATRNALHGVHWPIGNGKKLIIDFANVDDIESARNPPLTPPIPESMKIEKENEEPPQKQQKEPEEEERTKEKIKEKRRHEHIREWDVGKAEIHRGRSRSRDREKSDKRRHSRHSPSPFEDYVSRKQKKIDDHVPQKLMDDLFQKTKTTPSIYWQPLTPDEITTKQQQRLERMAEHKRRLEESTRTRAEFGRGGPYRRRYD